MHTYFNPKREKEPHALPDLEIFEADVWECKECSSTTCGNDMDLPTAPGMACPECGGVMGYTEPPQRGWYWQACFPGCLPDGYPMGPFATEEEALKDAREGFEEEEEPLKENPILLGHNGQLERDPTTHRWMKYADGGYPIVYYTKDGGSLCPDCANGENGSEVHESSDDAQWKLIGADVYWEGPPIICDNCGCAWESAYGDPNEENKEDPEE